MIMMIAMIMIMMMFIIMTIESDNNRYDIEWNIIYTSHYITTTIIIIIIYTGSLIHTVIEPSEEIRYLTCSTLYQLIKRVNEINAAPILHPYFQEMIIFLQVQLRDPYPEVKVIN
jgi:hypothetical protein